MVLDARLAKLATGQSAREAALAFSRSRHEKLEDAERARADEFEAILEAMFLMAAVDGEIAPDEVGQLAASVQAIIDTTGGKLKLDLGPAMDELGVRLARDGWKGRLDTLARRLPPRSKAIARVPPIKVATSQRSSTSQRLIAPSEPPVANQSIPPTASSRPPG